MYLPSYSKENMLLIEAIFSEISDIISLHSAYSVIVGGDFNNDLAVKSNCSNFIKEFMI